MIACARPLIIYSHNKLAILRISYMKDHVIPTFSIMKLTNMTNDEAQEIYKEASRSQTSDMEMMERTHRLTKGHLQYLLFGSRADHQI